MDSITTVNKTIKIGDYRVNVSRIEMYDKGERQHNVNYQVEDDPTKHLYFSGDTIGAADEVYLKITKQTDLYEIVPNKTGSKYSQSLKLKKLPSSESPKFLVINHKFLKELSEEDQKKLNAIIKKVKCDHEYLVVNRDEPYADQVEKLILRGEGIIKTCSICEHIGKITNGTGYMCENCGTGRSEWKKKGSSDD